MFCEKLRTLRKKQGLSQEQLAEALDVSRQSVSKWESGTCLPEPDKLVAISRYFKVSLDSLLTDAPEAPPFPAPEPAPKSRPRAGLVCSLLGVAGLLLWGALLLFWPAASHELRESSAVTIDGSGIFLLLSLGAIVAGVVLLLREKH